MIGNGLSASIRKIATSLDGSPATFTAVYSNLLGSCTMTLLAPLTTCWLVKINPVGSTISPLPNPVSFAVGSPGDSIGGGGPPSGGTTSDSLCGESPSDCVSSDSPAGSDCGSSSSSADFGKLGNGIRPLSSFFGGVVSLALP